MRSKRSGRRRRLGPHRACARPRGRRPRWGRPGCPRRRVVLPQLRRCRRGCRRSTACSSAHAAVPRCNSPPPEQRAPRGVAHVPVTCRCARGGLMRSIVISPRVSVPVLSDAITEAEPSVSTEASFLTMAWCAPCAARPAPAPPTGSPAGLRARRPRPATPPAAAPLTTSAAPAMSDVSEDRGHHDHGDRQRRDAQHAAHACAISFCERRRRLSRGVQQRGDPAHLGLHAGGGDNGAPRCPAPPPCP
jgi:hypothetical protein